jgi:hypothetical protein
VGSVRAVVNREHGDASSTSVWPAICLLIPSRRPGTSPAMMW